MPSLKADDCPVDTSAIFDAEDTLVGEEAVYHPQESNDAEAIASSDNHDHPGSAAVATTASFDTHGKETLITFTGFCWRCHSTEHKNAYKCPNAKDDKYDGNFEKNHMRYLELKAIEMKKEKKCCRCMTKKKLPEFFHCDWCKDEGECVCKDCRKLVVKNCYTCWTPKKKHSFKTEQWYCNEESDRVCNVCLKYKERIGNVWGKKKTSKYVSLSKKAKVQHKRKQ